VVEELANGQRRNGLWAKALANSGGQEEKAKALYIRYRVQSIRDEIEISEAAKEEAARKARVPPISERQKRVNQCTAALISKGYKIKEKGTGWIVIEPLGGRQPIKDIEELEQYAKSR